MQIAVKNHLVRALGQNLDRQIRHQEHARSDLAVRPVVLRQLTVELLYDQIAERGVVLVLQDLREQPRHLHAEATGQVRVRIVHAARGQDVADLAVVARQVQQRRLQQLQLGRARLVQQLAEILRERASLVTHPERVHHVHVLVREALHVHHLVQQREIHAPNPLAQLHQQRPHLAHLRRRRRVRTEYCLGQVLGEVDAKAGDQVAEVVRPSLDRALAVDVRDPHHAEERPATGHLRHLQLVGVSVPGDLQPFELEHRLVEQRRHRHSETHPLAVLRAVVEADDSATTGRRRRQSQRAVDADLGVAHHLEDLVLARGTMALAVQQQLLRRAVVQRDDVTGAELGAPVVQPRVVQVVRRTIEGVRQIKLGTSLVPLCDLVPGVLPNADLAHRDEVGFRCRNQPTDVLHVLFERQVVAEIVERHHRHRVSGQGHPVDVRTGREQNAGALLETAEVRLQNERLIERLDPANLGQHLLDRLQRHRDRGRVHFLEHRLRTRLATVLAAVAHVARANNLQRLARLLIAQQHDDRATVHQDPEHALQLLFRLRLIERERVELDHDQIILNDPVGPGLGSLVQQRLKADTVPDRVDRLLGRRDCVVHESALRSLASELSRQIGEDRLVDCLERIVVAAGRKPHQLTLVVKSLLRGEMVQGLSQCTRSCILIRRNVAKTLPAHLRCSFLAHQTHRLVLGSHLRAQVPVVHQGVLKALARLRSHEQVGAGRRTALQLYQPRQAAQLGLGVFPGPRCDRGRRVQRRGRLARPGLALYALFAQQRPKAGVGESHQFRVLREHLARALPFHHLLGRQESHRAIGGVYEAHRVPHLQRLQHRVEEHRIDMVAVAKIGIHHGGRLRNQHAAEVGLPVQLQCVAAAGAHALHHLQGLARLLRSLQRRLACALVNAATGEPVRRREAGERVTLVQGHALEVHVVSELGRARLIQRVEELHLDQYVVGVEILLRDQLRERDVQPVRGDRPVRRVGLRPHQRNGRVLLALIQPVRLLRRPDRHSDLVGEAAAQQRHRLQGRAARTRPGRPHPVGVGPVRQVVGREHRRGAEAVVRRRIGAAGRHRLGRHHLRAEAAAANALRGGGGQHPVQALRHLSAHRVVRYPVLLRIQQRLRQLLRDLGQRPARQVPLEPVLQLVHRRG